MEFKGLKVNEQNTNKILSTAQPPLPNGWYYLQLVSETKEKESRSPGLFGQWFTFKIMEGLNKDRTFMQWRATRSFRASDQWSVGNTEALFCRIAKCCSIRILNTSRQLHEITFVADLKQVKSKRKFKDLNKQTEEIEEKEVETINIDFVGTLDEIILSVEEYMLKTQPVEEYLTKTENTPEKKFKKRKPEPEPEPEDEEEDEFE